MLGNAIETALSRVGITERRVSEWLGRPCGCEERRNKLNALTWWALRVFSGRSGSSEKARAELDAILRPDEEEGGAPAKEPV